MKIRLLDLNVKNKKIEKTENDSLRGALVHIKYKKEEKIMLKYTTNNVTPPPEACTTWKAMYNGINELIDDLMEHISLENNVLFPRALAGE